MIDTLRHIVRGGLPALLLAAFPALAAPTQPFEAAAEICLRETRAAEQAMGIPRHLLGAIALAETGRWDADAQASFAWPWTVMAEGRGRYFPTKAEAVAEVKRLAARGITNIDVGCMQINLHHHGGAFANLAEALDPAANVAYAGTYLRNLFAAAGSWTRAAGDYHSMTPERSEAYREKVVELWNRTRRLARGEPAAEPPARAASAASAADAAPSRPRPASIDMERTAALNARLRSARAEERAVDFASRREEDLAAWRAARTAGPSARHTALMRRTQAAAERQRELMEAPETRSQSFAERRRDQLRRWRLSRADGEDAS